MRLKRVPGIEDGKVVGVVSRADLRRALVNEIATSATRTAHRARLERSPGLKALAVY
jgi:CBS domain-containing protein